MSRSKAFFIAGLGMLLGSCDRVPAPADLDLPGDPLLVVGAWNDSAEAAKSALTTHHPLQKTVSVGDRVWIRAVVRGDTSSVESIDMRPDRRSPWEKVKMPLAIHLQWPDSGTHWVHVAVNTAFGVVLDSASVHVSNLRPSLTLPSWSDTGILVVPDREITIPLKTTDDGRVVSVSWDLDGNGTWDRILKPTDTLRVRWSGAEIVKLGKEVKLRVQVQDEDSNKTTGTVVVRFPLRPASLSVSGPDTLSIKDSLPLQATLTGPVTASQVRWPDGSRGLQWKTLLPAIDTQMVVVVQAIDSLGRTLLDSHVVRVLRDPPVVQARPDTAIHAGKTLHLSATAQQRFGRIVCWKWDLNGDGSFRLFGAGIDTTWETVGPRNVVVRAEDDDGNVAFDTIHVRVIDSAAQISTHIPSSVSLGDTLKFGVTVRDPDQDSVAVSWKFAGLSQAGFQASVRPAAVGAFPVELTVKTFTHAGTLLQKVVIPDTVKVLPSGLFVDLGRDSTVPFATKWSPGSVKIPDSGSGVGIAKTSVDWNADGIWDKTSSGWLLPTRVFDQDTGWSSIVVRVEDTKGNQELDTIRVRILPPPAPSVTVSLPKEVWLDTLSSSIHGSIQVFSPAKTSVTWKVKPNGPSGTDTAIHWTPLLVGIDTVEVQVKDNWGGLTVVRTGVALHRDTAMLKTRDTSFVRSEGLSISFPVDLRFGTLHSGVFQWTTFAPGTPRNGPPINPWSTGQTTAIGTTEILPPLQETTLLDTAPLVLDLSSPGSARLRIPSLPQFGDLSGVFILVDSQGDTSRTIWKTKARSIPVRIDSLFALNSIWTSGDQTVYAAVTAPDGYDSAVWYYEGWNSDAKYTNTDPVISKTHTWSVPGMQPIGLKVFGMGGDSSRMLREFPVQKDSVWIGQWMDTVYMSTSSSYRIDVQSIGTAVNEVSLIVSWTTADQGAGSKTLKFPFELDLASFGAVNIVVSVKGVGGGDAFSEERTFFLAKGPPQ
ncbi:MAG: hypothetical protein H6686_12830 [Fibrobacteria bacterium]|nr:hypothetical protein [Fibrobacteria bacterium]